MHWVFTGPSISLILRNWHAPARDFIGQTVTHLKMNCNDIHIVNYMVNTAEPFPRPFPHDSLTTPPSASTSLLLEILDYVHQRNQENSLYWGRMMQNITISHQLFKHRNIGSRDRLHLERAYILSSTYWDRTPNMCMLNDECVRYRK